MGSVVIVESVVLDVYFDWNIGFKKYIYGIPAWRKGLRHPVLEVLSGKPWLYIS